MRNITKALDLIKVEVQSLPAEIQERLNNLDTQFNDYNTKVDHTEENPDNYSAEQISELADHGNELDVLDAELAGEIKAWHKAEKARLKAEADASAAKEEEDRKTAEKLAQEAKDEQDRIAAELAEKEKTDKQAAEQAEAERIAAEQKQGEEKKGSGALGIILGLGVTLLTFGAYNAFKNK